MKIKRKTTQDKKGIKVIAIQFVDHKKNKLGIAPYLDKSFEEKEKVVSDAAELKARFQYNMQEKNS